MKKIIESLTNVGLMLTLSSFFLAAVSYCADFYTRRCTEQIHSQSQLERIIQEERYKIGVRPSEIITATLENSEKMYGFPAYAERIKGNIYLLHFEYTVGNSRGVVRHELCHIYYGDSIKNISYYLIEEPRAVWCSLEF